MTNPRTHSIDELLKRGLGHRAAGDAGDLLELIVREAAAMPQRRALRWGLPTGSRRLLAVAVLALLVAALAGAIVIGFRPPRPLPALVPHANGTIVTPGAGCALVSLDPASGTMRTFFAGVPACFPTVSTYELAWDPAGSRLAFTYSFFCGGCGSADAKAAIAARPEGLWVLDPTTSKAEQLVQCSGFCSIGEFSWSPDGTRLAFTRDHQIWVVPSTGGSVQRVSEGQSVYGHPAWSPDSSQLAYVDANGGRAGVILANSDGTGRSVVSGPLGEVVQGIAWSPVARSVLVTSDTGDGGTIRIVPTDRSGSSNVLSLHDGTRPSSPHWSPDGSLIAYERTVETTDPQAPVTLTRAEIWVMAADGSNPQLLFQASSSLTALSDVLWSPDGRYLTFSLVPDVASASSPTYLAAANGSGVRDLGSALWNGFGVPSVAWQPLPVSP